MRLFWLEDGERVPYILETDDTALVVAKYVDTDYLRMIKKAEDTKKKYGRIMEDAGARSPDAPVIPGDKIRTMAQWTTESVKDNPIEGTDGLREEYMEARRKLVQSFEDRNEPCPRCVLGELSRKYYKKLIDWGWA
jgi:hypothetical protein